MDTTGEGARVAELIGRIEADGYLAGLSDEAARADPAVGRAYRELADRAIAACPAYPAGRFEGRGLVICGGGERYFPCAWVAIRMLRHQGCALPIELWHYGPGELDARQATLVRALGVEPVDVEAVRRDHPVRHLGGWELKCYAILHSRFREVLSLDADNSPVRDPAFLFEQPEYRAHGAVFWSDPFVMGPERTAWPAFGVEYRPEPEIESGQLLIDKERCWPALRLAWHYNDHSDYYYRHVYGDKDTFRMAWHRVGQSYASPSRPVDWLDGNNGCMCHHDFAGRRLFQHRNWDKFRLDGSNRRIDRFEGEDLCRQFLAELRTLWRGDPDHDPNPTPRARAWAADLAGRTLTAAEVPALDRPITLDPDGQVDGGRGFRLRRWAVRDLDGQLHLALLGTDGVAGLFARHGDATWAGRWLGRP